MTHCEPGDLRGHLVTLREHRNVAAIACRVCTAQFGITRDGRLARRAGSDGAWIVVAVEAGPAARGDAAPATGADACPPRLRGVIKGLQKRVGLDDAAYRALLRDVAGVASSTSLDEERARLVVRALEERLAS